MSKDEKLTGKYNSDAANRKLFADGLRASSPTYNAATDQVNVTGISGDEIDCSVIRDPKMRAELLGNADGVTNMMAPLPLPSAGVPTDVVRGIAEDRIDIRGQADRVIGSTIKACGPKAPGQ